MAGSEACPKGAIGTPKSSTDQPSKWTIVEESENAIKKKPKNNKSPRKFQPTTHSTPETSSKNAKKTTPRTPVTDADCEMMPSNKSYHKSDIIVERTQTDGSSCYETPNRIKKTPVRQTPTPQVRPKTAIPVETRRNPPLTPRNNVAQKKIPQTPMTNEDCEMVPSNKSYHRSDIIVERTPTDGCSHYETPNRTPQVRPETPISECELQQTTKPQDILETPKTSRGAPLRRTPQKAQDSALNKSPRMEPFAQEYQPTPKSSRKAAPLTQRQAPNTSAKDVCFGGESMQNLREELSRVKRDLMRQEAYNAALARQAIGSECSLETIYSDEKVERVHYYCKPKTYANTKACDRNMAPEESDQLSPIQSDEEFSQRKLKTTQPNKIIKSCKSSSTSDLLFNYKRKTYSLSYIESEEDEACPFRPVTKADTSTQQMYSVSISSEEDTNNSSYVTLNTDTSSRPNYRPFEQKLQCSCTPTTTSQKSYVHKQTPRSDTKQYNEPRRTHSEEVQKKKQRSLEKQKRQRSAERKSSKQDTKEKATEQRKRDINSKQKIQSSAPHWPPNSSSDILIQNVSKKKSADSKKGKLASQKSKRIYADSSDVSAHSLNVLNTRSSVCMLCKDKKLPVLKNNVFAEIQKIIGNVGTKNIILTITLQTNGIYHINISQKPNGCYLDCVYADENAYIAATKVKAFKDFVTFFVASDQSSIVNEKQLAVDYTIQFVRYIDEPKKRRRSH